MSAKEWARARVRNVLRRGLGVEDIGFFLRSRRIALQKRLYRRPVSLADFREDLIRLGFSPGRVVWVQSAWGEFYNVQAKPSEVIALMRDILGPEGTLAMPAFPAGADAEKVLEIERHPSSTGLLTEIFRRTKGVERSIHLQNSICAIGPLAHHLVKDHHRGGFPVGGRHALWAPGRTECPSGRVRNWAMAFQLHPPAHCRMRLI